MVSRVSFLMRVYVADQGRWFKLWCSSLTDSNLDGLDISDFGRWCKFGAHMKEHGTEGVIVLKPPERVLCSMFQVGDFSALLDRVRAFPNVSVTGVTNATVTFSNWSKYQGDNSAERTRRWRERVTPKKRREEKRREEMKVPPSAPREECTGFDRFWTAYPKKKAKGDAQRAWKALNPGALLLDRILKAVESQRESPDWQKSQGRYIPYPATWLRAQQWEDVLDASAGADELPKLGL